MGSIAIPSGGGGDKKSSYNIDYVEGFALQSRSVTKACNPGDIVAIMLPGNATSMSGLEYIEGTVNTAGYQGKLYRCTGRKFTCTNGGSYSRYLHISSKKVKLVDRYTYELVQGQTNTETRSVKDGDLWIEYNKGNSDCPTGSYLRGTVLSGTSEYPPRVFNFYGVSTTTINAKTGSMFAGVILRDKN